MKLEQGNLLMPDAVSAILFVFTRECSPRHMSCCRLPGNDLKNTDTGQCVHPYGGWKGEGVKLSYLSGCDPVARMSLEFLKLGKYLGLQSYSMKFSLQDPSN